jgi:uncharacterized SAM-binding protein YcdF (DUF218 family)
MKSNRLHIFVYGVLSVLLVSFVVFLKAGRFLSSPASSPRKADAIVVLGGGRGERNQLGIELFKQGYAPWIVLTGFNDSRSEAGSSYLKAQLQVFLSAGIRVENILFDRISTNTWEEARNTLALMQKRGWHNVIIVSDPPHMRRLNMVFGLAFRGTGLRCTLVSTGPQWWNDDKWWENKISANFVAAEYKKLFFYDVLSMLF